MKVTELLEATSRIVDLRDPDDAPGAVDREAAARAKGKSDQEAAVENLNKLVSKYKLGGGWKVGTSSSIVGTFIMPDHKGGAAKAKFKTNAGAAEATLWVAGRYDDLVLSLYDVDMSRDQKNAALAKMKELLPGVYFMKVQSDDRRDFKSVSFHFGYPSTFSDSKKFAGLKKFFDYLKKEAQFS